MRRILVTGGAGFIGSNFVRYWARRNPADRLVILDSLTYAASETTVRDVVADGKAIFVCGDICDGTLLDTVLAAHAVDTVVHFAAESHVDRSIVGPDAFIQTNIVGTHVLLGRALNYWRSTGRLAAGSRFHHVSTDEVYGSLGSDDPPFRETTPYAPNSPYAASKAAADHLVRAYHHTYGLNATISNCSNNYGPYQFPEKLIPLMLVNLLDGERLPVYGDGQNVRDWLNVEDHCRAIEVILNRGVVGQTYNVGGCCERSNLEVVGALCKLVDELFLENPRLRDSYPNALAGRGKPSAESVCFVTDRLGHDRRYAVDAGKIRDHLGYRSSSSFDEGLRETVNWYLTNEHWWRPLLNQRAVAA